MLKWKWKSHTSVTAKIGLLRKIRYLKCHAWHGCHASCEERFRLRIDVCFRCRVDPPPPGPSRWSPRPPGHAGDAHLAPQRHHRQHVRQVETMVHGVFTITEKAPTSAFSWLKAATTAFTFKTLLRHYAKQALTPQ